MNVRFTPIIDQGGQNRIAIFQGLNEVASFTYKINADGCTLEFTSLPPQLRNQGVGRRVAREITKRVGEYIDAPAEYDAETQTFTAGRFRVPHFDQSVFAYWSARVDEWLAAQH